VGISQGWLRSDCSNWNSRDWEAENGAFIQYCK